MIKGWYEVDNKRYFSKVEALIAAKNDISKLNYFWQPEIWNHVDFTVEPTESWDNLLKYRCLELREKYGWLQLFFSGGWDSTTILDTFVKHNIRLDEIIIFDRKFLTDPEIPTAIEYAKNIKKNFFPDIQLTILPVEYNFGDKFFDEHQDQWIYNTHINMRYTRWMDRGSIFKYSDSYLRSADQHKTSVGLIEGKDKPKLLLKDNDWYTFFVDSNTIDNSLSPIEDFYYSKTLPELHVKQLHMAIDWFEQNINFINDQDYIHLVQSNKAPESEYISYNIGIGRTCINNAHAQGGRMKSWHENNINALQTQRVVAHEKSIDSKSWGIYVDGLQQVKELTNVDIFNNTIPDSITEQRLVKKRI